MLGPLNGVESAQTPILVEQFQHLAESALPVNQTVLETEKIPNQYWPSCWEQNG